MEKENRSKQALLDRQMRIMEELEVSHSKYDERFLLIENLLLESRDEVKRLTETMSILLKSSLKDEH